MSSMPVRQSHHVRRLASLLVLAGALVPLAGCENHDPTLFAGAREGGPVSLDRDVQPIFNRSCALSGCHNQQDHHADMILEAGGLYDPVFGIVNVPSTEAPGLLRVEPGDSSRSYLINKLEGTQASVGGKGERMPLGGRLPDDEIETIKNWIDDGARDN